MEKELFVKIIGAIITILVGLITTYVIPAIKANVTEKDMNTLLYWISVAVRCADQIYTKEQWKEKKEYVYNYIIDVVNSKLRIKLSPADIDTLIEGIVNEIHENGIKEKIE